MSGLLIFSTDAQISTAAKCEIRCSSSLPTHAGHGLKNIGLTTVSRGIDLQLTGLMTDHTEQQLNVVCLLQELTL